MILKTMRIILVVSCAMLSLIALAESNTANYSQESNTQAIENTIATEDTRLTNKSEIAKDLISDENLILKNVTVGVLNPVLTPEQESSEKSIVHSAGQISAEGMEKLTDKATPKVGKHVMANMNPVSMILSLFLVLGLIIVCALIIKRFNLTQQGVNQLKVVSTLRLGTKERIIVVQVGEQQLLLGVTNQNITLLDTLSEPLTHQTMNTGDLPTNILSFLSSKKSSS